VPPGLVATRSLHSRTVPAAERAAAAGIEEAEVVMVAVRVLVARVTAAA